MSDRDQDNKEKRKPPTTFTRKPKKDKAPDPEKIREQLEAAVKKNASEQKDD